MIKIDMWYGNPSHDADKIDVTFYPNAGCYMGNIYKNDKCIGDYICNDSNEIEIHFPGLVIIW